MSATPDSPSANPEQRIADLEHQLAEREAELAECKAERDGALQRETATAEVLQVINSSSGDLAPVFDAMLEKALRLCGAAFGLLFTWDGEWLHPAAWRNISPKLLAVLREPTRPQPGTLSWLFARGENIVSTADLLENESYRNGIARVRALVEFGGARSHIGIALRKDGALLGHLSIYRQEVRPFTDKETALLQNFAAQAVIAIENARLITETREALEQQTATAEVLGVINASPGDLAPVFDAILEKARAACGFARGSLNVYDGECFRTVATYGLSEPFAALLRQPRRTGPPARLLEGDRIVHIADVSAERLSDDPVVYRAALEAGDRTVVFVPLRNEQRLLGYITANRQEVRPFSEKEIALLENFAAQAVIAMENARLIAETREALEQQTATAEVLGVINSSPGDLTPVFDAILDKAVNLCSASFGLLMKYDGEALHTVAHYNSPPKFVEFLRTPVRPAPGMASYRILRGEDAVTFADVAADPSYAAGSEAGRTLVELSGAHSHLTVALRKEDVFLGQIVLYRREVLPFTPKQIALVQNFAAQAVIAMENARLITETREALEQQTATAEVLQVINASPGDLGPVFDAMLERSVQLCDAAQGVLRTYDGEFFNFAAVRGEPRLMELARQQGSIRIRPDGPFGSLVEGEQVVHFADIRESEVYRKNPRARASIDLGGGRSWLAVALRSETTLLGAISVYRQEVRPFSDKQIGLLQNFAAQAVVAMENARLLGELRQSTEEVAELNRGLEMRVAEQVEELGRVGRLKRFLAPQLAELIVSQGDEKILESHRREIVVVFCDLRGYTAFTETAEPEEVLDFLRQYHGALGPLVSQFEGTLDQFSGDGIMVFFNDPVPCADPAERAVKMAMAMREAAGELITAWHTRGCELGFGVGIAQGYATLGQIGFSERSGYTAIGTVCNLASRLCAEAKDGQILIAGRVAAAVGTLGPLEDLGTVELKGLSRPVAAFNVAQSTSAADTRRNLTVVATEPEA